MIEVITDKRDFEECETLVRKIVDTEPWRERLAAVWDASGATLGHPRERCWQFRVECYDEDGERDTEYIRVSRDSSKELPFTVVIDPATREQVRRHIDPVTGEWIEDFTENVKNG